MEHGDVAPLAVPRWPQRVAHTCFNRELRARLPVVLHEPVERRRHPGRQRLLAHLGVVAEIAQRRIPQGESSRLRMAGVEESHLSVLVVGRALAGGGELDVIVLPGTRQSPRLSLCGGR